MYHIDTRKGVSHKVCYATKRQMTNYYKITVYIKEDNKEVFDENTCKWLSRDIIDCINDSLDYDPSNKNGCVLGVEITGGEINE